MPSMNVSETRLREVPSMEDLEKIERRLEPQPDKYEVNISKAFTRGEIVERLAEQDERLEDTEYTIGGKTFSYEGLEGVIDVDEDRIHVEVFESGENDLDVRDVKRIGGASTGRTMHDRGVSTYRNFLQKAGYDADELNEEALMENAEEALEDLGYESFEVEIDGSAREA
jgi:hypothetical protein